MKNKWVIGLIVACLTIGTVFSSCGVQQKDRLDPQNPTVVTFWHSYNSSVKSVLDDLILEFNDTVGAEKGIIIDAYGYGEQSKLEEALFNSSNGIIGAEAMPDMFIAYPDNAYRIDALKPLADLKDYFSEEELSEFRQEFLEEGLWKQDGPLKMLPVAKSTEFVYVNKTDWETFFAGDGAGKDKKTLEGSFASWDNIVSMAERYYEQSGGKPFLGVNLNNDFMHVTAAQMGKVPYSLNEDGVTFSYSREFAKKVWETCYIPHIKGWFQSAFYNQDSVREGKLLAYIGSSAGSGYFPKEVTLSTGDSYPIECEVLGYPTISSPDTNERYMSQRGANVCVTKTDIQHEYAATEFLKWFTGKENNLKFAVSTGYIPVKNEALQDKESLLNKMGASDNDSALKSSIEATLQSLDTQKFVVKKPFMNSYEANTIFSFLIFEKITADVEEKQKRIAAGEREKDVIAELISDKQFEEWYDELENSINESLR